MTRKKLENNKIFIHHCPNSKLALNHKVVFLIIISDMFMPLTSHSICDFICSPSLQHG